MSQNLFTKAPLLRTATRRALPQTARYSTTNAPKMSGPQQLRTLIRQTTLRASTTALQRASYPISQHIHTRARTPSPPPPYPVRSTTLLAPTGQWTRFTSPYALSSIRTFTSSPSKLASETTSTNTSQFAPETQKRIDAIIEEISDLYGTAKDEFDIASEESEKNTTYAADDRAAAREELDRLVEFYKSVTEGYGEEGVVKDEVKRRVGQRIRELVAGVEAMEEEAIHGDH
jgi:hypothetical protein